MTSGPHILLLNEFFHPDICASAVVATDHLTKIAKLRPDWKITVLTGNRAWDDPAKVYPAREKYAGLDIVRVVRPAPLRSNLVVRGIAAASLHRRMLAAVKKLGRVDLVIGTTAPPQGGVIAAKIAGKKRCPLIYKVLDLYPDLAVTLGRLRGGSFIHRRWLTHDAAAMRAAAAVVAISTPMIERIAATRGIARDKLHVIHDGYDPTRLRGTGDSPVVVRRRNTFRAEHNPDGKFIVQYAGNMGLSHPFETILAAARTLARTDKDLLFQFIGDGPGRIGLQEGLPKNARLIPFQPAERLGEVLDAADVCLISQHSEMFDQAMPYKVYAILAAGKPTIFVGSERSEIAQWLNEFGAGRMVKQNDAGGLANAIREMKSGARNCQTMGKAARVAFDERFHSLKSARKWVALIERTTG